MFHACVSTPLMQKHAVTVKYYVRYRNGTIEEPYTYHIGSCPGAEIHGCKTSHDTRVVYCLYTVLLLYNDVLHIILHR